MHKHDATHPNCKKQQNMGAFEIEIFDFVSIPGTFWPAENYQNLSSTAVADILTPEKVRVWRAYSF